MSESLSPAETFYWMKLAHLVRYAGARSCETIYRKLQQRDWSLGEVFALSEPEFAECFPHFGRGHYARLQYGNFHQQISEDDELELRRVLRHLREEVQIVPLPHPDYPSILRRQLGRDAPPILYAEGQIPLLHARSIGVIGSRSADRHLLGLTKEMVTALSVTGYNIVSGYARGVDGAAHRAALLADGTTTLVLPRGIQTYLMKPELRVHGWQRNHLTVSQFHPLAVPHNRCWQQRNRTLVGLSEAIVVMDANGNDRGGGTASAARFALGRRVPVFVLSPDRFRYRAYGNMDLIAAGGIEFSGEAELLSGIEAALRVAI